MSQVGKGILAGYQVKDSNVSNEEVGDKAYHVGGDEVSHVLEGSAEIILGANGIGDQGKDSKGSQTEGSRGNVGEITPSCIFS